MQDDDVTCKEKNKILAWKNMHQVLTRFDVLIACNEKYVISN